MNRAAAARDPQVETAQRLAMEADDGAELDVEIDILVMLLLVVGAGQRRLEEAAAVKELAAHRNAQRAVWATIGFKRSLVAVGKAEDREACGLNLARGIDLDSALDRRIGRLEHDVLEPRPRRLVDKGEGCTAGLARRLRPSRQQIVDLGRRQVSLDREPGVAALLRRHAPGELDRDRTFQEPADVETELAARSRRGWPGRGHRRRHRAACGNRDGRNAVELDVASDPVALVVGVTFSRAASTFWPMTMRSAAKLATSMLMA